MRHDRQRSSKAVEIAGEEQRHQRGLGGRSAVVERTEDDDSAVRADRVCAKVGEVEVQGYLTKTRFSDTAAANTASSGWPGRSSS